MARVPRPPRADARSRPTTPPATTASWTSRRRFAGSSATSPSSAATRATSRSSASRPAGRASTSQLASPLAAGLFQRAIAQSGAYARQHAVAFAGRGRGHDVADSGRLPGPDRRVPAVGSGRRSCSPTQPTADCRSSRPSTDTCCRRVARAAFESGEFNRVPVIEGSTHDEFRSYAAIAGPQTCRRAFYPLVVRTFVSTLGLNVNPADDRQAVPDHRLPGRRQARACRRSAPTALFAAPAVAAARSFSKFVPTHAYEFNDPNAADSCSRRRCELPVRRLPRERAALPVRLDDARRPRSADARPGAAGGGDGALLDAVRGDGRPELAGDSRRGPPTPRRTTPTSRSCRRRRTRDRLRGRSTSARSGTRRAEFTQRSPRPFEGKAWATNHPGIAGSCRADADA